MYTLWKLWQNRAQLTAALMVTIVACGGGGVTIPGNVTDSTGWGALQPTYDGTARAWGKGTYENRGASVMVLNGTYQDKQADGNGAYVKVTFQERRPTASGGTSWQQVTTQSTPEIGTSAGVDPIRASGGQYLHYDHAKWSDSFDSRAYTQVCAQFGWPVSDPCQTAVPTLPI